MSDSPKKGIRCPAEDELYAILAGDGSPAEAAHVANCELCRVQLRKLQSEATILRHVGEKLLGKTETTLAMAIPGAIGKFIVVGIWDDNPWFVTYRGLHAVVRRDVLIQVAKTSIRDFSGDPQAFPLRWESWRQPRPHVAQLLDAGEFDSRPYLVVEFNDGVRLDRLIGDEQLEGATLMQIFSQVAKTLADDPTPHPLLCTASIVVDEQDQPTLVDWAASAEFDSTRDDNSDGTEKTTARRLAIAFCNSVLPEALVSTSISATASTGSLTGSLVSRQIPTAVAEFMAKAVTAESNVVPSLAEFAAVLAEPSRKPFWRRLFC